MSTQKGRKRSPQEDLEYEDIDDTDSEETTQSQVTTPSRRGRPPKKAKYTFTLHDRELLKKGLREHGRGFASIAKEYFSGCKPPVTSVDVRNYVNGDPELREFAEDSM